MKIKLTRRSPFTKSNADRLNSQITFAISNVNRLTTESIRYEIFPVEKAPRIFEEVFEFSNIKSMWLSPAQGEAVMEMAKPFRMHERTILPAIADEEEIWICSDDTYTELHIMVDAFEYFEVL